MATTMKPTTILAKYFRKDGQTLASFAAEIKELTADDKDELVTLAAVELGVEIDRS